MISDLTKEAFSSPDNRNIDRVYKRCLVNENRHQLLLSDYSCLLCVNLKKIQWFINQMCLDTKNKDKTCMDMSDYLT